MKKAIIIICSLGGFMLFAFIAARLTHVIDVYQVSSASNEPTHPHGSIVMASCLKTADRGAFICFKQHSTEIVRIYRCIAKEGDLIEIKNAAVYLNGKLLNEPYTWNEYYISRQQLAAIQGYVDTYKYPVNPINDSLYSITFSTAELSKYHLNLKSVTVNKGEAYPEIFSDFSRLNFNGDNLGPLKVPKNCYFLLGDNRHNAFDSRYIGFIKKDEIISTVIE